MNKDLDREFKWDDRFLKLAEHISSWSLDPSTKVGAVITDSNNRIVSVGYNGFARGIKDSPERLNDRAIKYPIIIHGEINAILFANRNLNGCTLYTFPFQPCANCTSIIIQSGISTVVSFELDVDNERNKRWKDSFSLSNTLFREAGVKTRFYGGGGG